MEESMTDVSEQGSETQSDANAAGGDTGGFSVPEEYKDAGWSKNIKSYDDLWKMNANAQSLIGRKTIGIPSDKSTPEEWQSFFEKVRPEKAEEYGLELDGDDKAFYEKLFFDNGISTKQAKGIMGAYQERMQQALAGLTSEEGFRQEMQGRFGDKYEDTVKSLSALIAREASDADKKVLNAMPNNVLGIMYGIINSIKTRYAVNDSDAAKSGGSAASGVPDYAGYCKEVEALNRRPHSTADIAALKSKYNIPIIK